MQERIEQPRLSGLDDWSVGLDFAMFSIFYPILSLIKGKFCFFVLFTIQVCGWKMMQYTPGWMK